MKITVQTDVSCPCVREMIGFLKAHTDCLEDDISATLTTDAENDWVLDEFTKALRITLELQIDALHKKEGIDVGWQSRIVTNYIVAEPRIEDGDRFRGMYVVVPRADVPSLADCRFSPKIRWATCVYGMDAVWKKAQEYKQAAATVSTTFSEEAK